MNTTLDENVSTVDYRKSSNSNLNFRKKNIREFFDDVKIWMFIYLEILIWVDKYDMVKYVHFHGNTNLWLEKKKYKLIEVISSLFIQNGEYI